MRMEKLVTFLSTALIVTLIALMTARETDGEVTESENEDDLLSLSKENITTRTAGAAVRALLSITEQSNTFNAQNNTMAVDILEKLVTDGNILSKNGSEFLKIVSNLLLVDQMTMLESQTSNKTSNRILSLIDDYTDKVPVSETGKLTETTRNLAVFIERINATKFNGTTAAMLSPKNNVNVTFVTSITLPRSILNNTRFNPTRISVVIFRNPNFFRPVNDNKSKIFEVITAARFNGNHSYKNLQEPVVIKFTHGNLSREGKLVCVFWDSEADKGFGNWSTEGCVLQETKDGVSTCHCDHLTHFGLLLKNQDDQQTISSLSEENEDDLFSLSKENITTRTAGPVGRALLSITGRSNTFNAQNTTMAVDILEKLVSDGNILTKNGSEFLKIVSNLLLVEKITMLESQRSNKTSNRIVSLIDDYRDKVPLPETGNLTEVRSNLAVFVQRINVTKFKGTTATMLQSKNKSENFTENRFYISEKPDINVTFVTSITLPPSILNNTRFAPTRMSVVIFRKHIFFQPVNDNKSKIFEVITAARFNGNHSLKNLQEPVVINFTHGRNFSSDRKPVCVFWDSEADKGFGNWSTEGCFLLETKHGVSTCHCNHLTHFGLLLNPYNNPHDKITKDHQLALEIISYIGCGLSLAGVALTGISFMLFRDQRRKSGIKLIISFCVALALLLITFILGSEKSSRTSDWQCQTSAIFLHYFSLVVFASMAVLGYDLYVKLVRKERGQQNKTGNSSVPLKYWLVSWGVPIIVVAITVAVSRNSYGNGKYCSLVGLPAVVSLAVPVAIIILANAVVFVKIILSLRESSNISSSRKSNPGQQLLTGIAILMILGITWVFGFLTLGYGKLTFQYLFTVFSSLQGFFIFVLHCLVPRQMRSKYKELFKCTKENKSLSNDARDTLTMNTLR